MFTSQQTRAEDEYIPDVLHPQWTWRKVRPWPSFHSPDVRKKFTLQMTPLCCRRWFWVLKPRRFSDVHVWGCGGALDGPQARIRGDFATWRENTSKCSCFIFLTRAGLVSSAPNERLRACGPPCPPYIYLRMLLMKRVPSAADQSLVRPGDWRSNKNTKKAIFPSFKTKIVSTLPASRCTYFLWQRRQFSVSAGRVAVQHGELYTAVV